MESIVRELAEAHELVDDLYALMTLCAGPGLRDKWDLLRLPEGFRASRLGAGDVSAQGLTIAWTSLHSLVDKAPPGERTLLQAAFGLAPSPNGDALNDRLVALRLGDGATTDELMLRLQLAFIQMLLRLGPAAEAVPAPPTGLEGRRNEGSAAKFFAEDYVTNSEAFRKIWSTAQAVDMWGFGHNRMSISYSREMQSLLMRGGTMRILLQDPEGSGVIEANQRSSTPKASDEAVRYQHRAGVVTLQAIAEGAQSPADAMQVRFFPGMPPFTAYFFDAGQANATAFIWLWSWRQPSSWRPGFLVHQSNDPLWFDRFHGQFVELWKHCRDRVIPTGGAT